MRRPPILRTARALAIGALLAAGAARAGPPYVTDDPEPTGLGRWEIYAFTSDTIFPHGTAGQSGLDINYGGATDLQLSAVVSLADDHSPGESTRLGVADTQLGAKYRILHQRQGSWMPDVALFPKINLPTANRRFGSGRVGASLPIWAQKDLGEWSLFGGGGWTLNPGAGNRNYAFGGAAVTRRLSSAVALGAEVYHQTSDALDTRASTGIAGGATWQIAPTWSLIGSAGPLFEHQTKGADFAFYLSLEFHN